MKKAIILITIVLITYSVGNSQEIKWYSWSEGYEIAKKENKKVLVFIYADWCHLCKRMLDKTFTDQEVISNISNNYVAVKFNYEIDSPKKMTYRFNDKDLTIQEFILMLWNAEKGQPVQLAVPTSIFFDINSKKSEKISGALSPADYIIDLNRYSSK
ncbi:MAG: DUF255 domain-containing protein [Bacteroidales bacterium]|nr:DUF255 domain-containing protein [Bacteroidales bacterium]